MPSDTDAKQESGVSPRTLHAAFAVSHAHIITLPTWNELLHLAPSERYFLPSFGRGAYLAALLIATIAAAAIFALVRLYARTERPWLRYALGLLFLASMGSTAEFLRQVLGFDIHVLTDLLVDHRIALFLGLGAAAIVGLWVLIYRLRLVVRVAAAGILILTPFAAMDYGRAAFAAVTADTTQLPQAAQINRKPAPQRVVWLTFDEMEQRLAFDKRPSRIDLPNFDALLAQAVTATNARAPGTNTQQSMPGLISGLPFPAAHRKDANTLLTKIKGEAEPIPWADRPSVFKDAIARDHTVHIGGYYHPYCRQLVGQWTSCSRWAWLAVHYVDNEDVLAAMAVQLWGATPLYRLRRALALHDQMRPQHAAVAADSGVDFAFLHASVPHHPYIYNSASGDYTFFRFGAAGYLDNLVAADRFLGVIRQRMVEAEVWDSSVIIVTSDHNWRNSAGWDGKVDRRVPLIIKMPGQKRGLMVAAPLMTVFMRELVGKLLAGEISTPEQLAAWLRAHQTQ